MAVSEVAICNLALQKLGAARITSLTQDDPNARECNAAYVPTRDKLLRRYAWSFAKSRANLAAHATAPAFQYGYAFPLPTDFLRLILPADSSIDWIVERHAGRRAILSNDSGPLYIKYIALVTDPTEFDPLFEEIYDYCDKMELNVDTLIHEVGAGQMEINFFHAEPLGLADEVFFFKRTVREAALRHDMYATFMAKPIAAEPGSAMHVHQSILDKATGLNIFSNPDGSASEAFMHYIGGLQRYIPAAMVLVAPYVNSYRRLSRNTAAPINIEWGYDNRTVGIRSPISSPQARRVENRVIGADANPYVALAMTLACGYLGLKNKIKPKAEMKGDAYLSPYALPRSLGEALDWLRRESDLHEVLGKEFITVYAEIKELEFDEFMKVISPWEREHLLLHV